MDCAEPVTVPYAEPVDTCCLPTTPVSVFGNNNSGGNVSVFGNDNTGGVSVFGNNNTGGGVSIFSSNNSGRGVFLFSCNQRSDGLVLFGTAVWDRAPGASYAAGQKHAE